MGKYMRKAKVSGGVVVAPAVIEGPQKAFLGVRTRARALALQRLPPTPPLSQQTPREDPYAYLQLRSRRLERNLAAKAKPSAAVASTGAAASPNHSPSNAEVADGKPEESSGKSSSQGSVSVSRCFFSNREKWLPEVDGGNRVGASVPTASPEFIAGVEASFGENVPEPESSRSVRETTPCSQIQDSETSDAPGSTTRPMVATSSKNKPQKIIPDCNLFDAEMHEFFSLKEQTQQKMFQIKYNYDIVNDQPLPGRYEWTKLDA